MDKPLTATDLRANLYRVLDEVLATGVPTMVTHKGRSVVLAPAAPGRRRFGLAVRRRAMTCTLDELVQISWEDAWGREL